MNMKKLWRSSLLIFLFILLTCSKEYSGDIKTVSLEGKWHLTKEYSKTWLEPEQDWNRWYTIDISDSGYTFLNKQKKDTLWIRKNFVISGHFVDKVLYLNLGKTGGEFDLYLNGNYLGHQDSRTHPFGDKAAGQYLLELKENQLHFGKNNALGIHFIFRDSSTVIFKGKPGIYSRLGLLEANDIDVGISDFETEREIHSILENLGNAWENQDTSALEQFVSPDFERRQQAANEFLSDILKKKQNLKPTDIELFQPGFYRSRADSGVLIIGDWIFHLENESIRKFPFQWWVKRQNHRWVIYGSGIRETQKPDSLKNLKDKD